MKNPVKYILVGFLITIVFSCNNNFLNDGVDLSNNADAGIYISPEWGTADYTIHVPMAGNAKFSIVKSPDWLQVNTPSGQFINDVATINCSASVCKDFSAVGIYNSVMILDINGKGKSLVPVSYITEGNPVIETERDIIMQYDYYGSYAHAFLNISNSGEGILLWGIAEKPEWITLALPGGTTLPDQTRYPLPQGSSITLDLSYNNSSIPSSDLSGKIVITSNDKNNREKVINIRFNMGNPSLSCYYNQLNFGRTEVTQTMEFSNQGYGLLTWKIESCPEWLSVSEASGALLPYSYKTLTFTCDRSLMPSGQQTQTIYLKTNDTNNPSYAITVTAINYTVNPENIRAISGTVADAWMDKTAGILYLATSQPNRLLAYNTKTKTIDKELVLSKAPTCFSISEDGHNAVIGHSGLISAVNMDNFSVTKTFEMDYIIFDIEWGAGNWCCYTYMQSEWYNLPWINLDTRETLVSSGDNWNIYDNSLIKKIPDKDYVIASRLSMFPSGIIVYNVQNHSLKQYFHQDLGNFWISSDGNYIFSSYNQIFRTSSVVTSSDYVSSIGSFSPSPYQFFWIDHSAASHWVWVLSSSSDYYYDAQREIMQYEDNNYTRVKSYYYDESYNGYPSQAQYVFANSAGDEIIAIKKNNRNEWAIEHVPVK